MAGEGVGVGGGGGGGGQGASFFWNSTPWSPLLFSTFGQLSYSKISEGTLGDN